MMEAHVWIGTSGRWSPFQRFEEGTLSLDGDRLTLRSAEPVSVSLSESELAFPLSMTGAGFVLTVHGRKRYVWFMDPFAGRSTFLTSFDRTAAQVDGAKSLFAGWRAARPWLKTLRATTR
jgi:hypothetical protein